MVREAWRRLRPPRPEIRALRRRQETPRPNRQSAPGRPRRPDSPGGRCPVRTQTTWVSNRASPIETASHPAIRYAGRIRRARMGEPRKPAIDAAIAGSIHSPSCKTTDRCPPRYAKRCYWRYMHLLRLFAEIRQQMLRPLRTHRYLVDTMGHGTMLDEPRASSRTSREPVPEYEQQSRQVTRSGGRDGSSSRRPKKPTS